MPFRKNRMLYGLVFILLVTFFSYVKYHRYNQGLSIVISSDAEGYYQYLTALFVEHDVLAQPYGYPLPNGKTFNKYNYGVALMEMPFFLVAHGMTKLFDLPAKGKFTLYVFSIIISTAFYVYLALLFLFKLLRKKFSRKVSLFSLCILFFGTNLLYYTIFEPGMSHAYAFFLMTFWIYAVNRFYEKPGWSNAFLLALPFGLLSLIRLPHILIVFYLPLYKVSRIPDFNDRFRILIKQWKPLLLLPLALVIFYLPQILYWHEVSGNYFVNPYDYSYADEGFPFVFHPRILQVLFSPVGGWLTINPLILLALAGLFLGIKNKKLSPWGVMLMLVFPVYLYASWWHPNIDASFGHRGMVDVLPFLVLPLAFLVEKLWKLKNVPVKKAAFGLIILFIFINLRLSYEYSYIWWDVDWGWPQYFEQILKTIWIS